MGIALRKNSNRGTVGLDLDGGFLAAVQASGDGVTRAASFDLAPGIISDGEVTDVHALTEALDDLIRSPGRRLALGLAAHERARSRYSVGAMVSSTAAVYQEALERY